MWLSFLLILPGSIQNPRIVNAVLQHTESNLHVLHWHNPLTNSEKSGECSSLLDACEQCSSRLPMIVYLLLPGDYNNKLPVSGISSL